MPPTDKQINYLEILFNDLGFNRAQRIAWLNQEVEYHVHDLGDLDSRDASRMIDKMKRMKEEQA